MMEEYQNKQQKKAERQEAGANTAHVAGKAAATYFGGTVGNIAYDKISQTKLGQGIENAAGKVISKIPVVNDLNKQLNDTGLVDVADKAVDLVGGKGAGKAAKGLKGAKGAKNLGKGVSKMGSPLSKKPTNLGNASANSNTSSVPKALQNKNHNQSIKNRFLNSSSSKTEEETNSEDNLIEDSDENGSDILNSKTGVAVFKKMLPMLLMVGGIIFLIVFLVVLISNFLSVMKAFVGIEDNNTAYVDDGYNEVSPEEQKYYDTLFETIFDYQDKYGVTLDRYLLHAIVSYKYFNASFSDLYESGTDISDEEFDSILNNIENSEDESDTTNQINYTEATKKIKLAASVMIVKNSDGTYSTDKEREGIVYNNLIASDFLKTYYKDFLKDFELETRTKLVEDIYDYAYLAYELLNESYANNVLSDTAVVYLQTCDVPYTKKTVNGLEIFDNPLTNEGTNYPTYLSLKDYVKGVLMAEVGGRIKEEYREGLKAFSIVILSYLLEDSRSGFNLKSGEMYFPSGNCRQVACDPTYGCSYGYETYQLSDEVENYGTAFTGTDRVLNHFGNPITYVGWKEALTQEENEFLDGILAEVFGDVMVKKGITSDTFTGSSDVIHTSHYASTSMSDCTLGTCFGQDEALEDGKNGMNYLDILHKYYSNIEFDVINVKEGIYVQNADFADAEYSGNVIFYDQNDYKQTFCGVSGKTISSSGCGVTAAAIVVSTFYQDNTYDPLYMNELARKNGACGSWISGTSTGFFQRVAKEFNLNYQSVGDSGANTVIQALKTGNSLVVAHMGKGLFTNGGHYIVLTGINSKGQVYVHDPNNRQNSSRRGTGNGWYDINTIADQLKGNFHILTKR